MAPSIPVSRVRIHRRLKPVTVSLASLGPIVPRLAHLLSLASVIKATIARKEAPHRRLSSYQVHHLARQSATYARRATTARKAQLFLCLALQEELALSLVFPSQILPAIVAITALRHQSLSPQLMTPQIMTVPEATAAGQGSIARQGLAGL
jgi:hypothetical protein